MCRGYGEDPSPAWFVEEGEHQESGGLIEVGMWHDFTGNARLVISKSTSKRVSIGVPDDARYCLPFSNKVMDRVDNERL